MLAPLEAENQTSSLDRCNGLIFGFYTPEYRRSLVMTSPNTQTVDA